MRKDADESVYVSVIVLTYNHAAYIERALEGVFMQRTSYNYEVLIGDDASTDGTQTFLQGYARRYPDKVRLFLRESNVGATRNAYGLFMQSAGRYVAALEGDDYWTDPDKLQKQVNFLERHPRYVGTCHRFTTVDSDGRPIKRRLTWVRHKRVFTLKDFKGIYLPSQSSTFVLRNLYRDKSRDYTFIYRMDDMICDRTLMIYFLAQGNFYCFGDVMGAYRITTRAKAPSVSNARYRDNERMIEQDTAFTNRLERFAREELGIRASFFRHRMYLYAQAWGRYWYDRSAENYAVFDDIVGDYRTVAFWGVRLTCLLSSLWMR